MAKKDNTLPILTHILGLVSGFLGPLILLLAVKDEYTKKHARVVLNWQISYTIYIAISAILTLLLIGILFLVAFSIINVIFSIIGAMRASENKVWKYPLSIPFFKVK